MPYIGNKPLAKYATLTRQTFSSPTGTSHTLSQTVTNSDDLLLYINNVKQNPADYTASGTTLTTASLAGGTEMYCLYYGKTTETVAVPSDSVDSSHIVDDAIDSEHYTDGSIDNVHLATGIDAAKLTTGTLPIARIADDAITLAKMASGTDGQIITYDASGNPVAVGPGTDGQVLTSTGAGSPPAFEATSGKYKVLSTTYDISVTGSLAVTGAGFEPKFVYIHYGTGAWVTGRFGWGGSDGTTHKSMNDANKQTSDSWMQSNYLMDNIYASSVYAYITGVTLDSDGVTFTRAKFGTPTGTITLNIFCFG